MNKKSWLIVGLSLAMAASIGVGISACGGETHTHNYDAWDYNETQHWKYCDEHGSDKSNIDETTKANHDFKDGKCECGATEGQEIPDADLDTREFWATGAGAGDLQNSSWTELKPNFKLTKQPHKDEDGFTLYTIQFKIYAGGDSFKIRQDEKDENGALKWTDGTYFGIDELHNASGTFIDAGTKNIGIATGKDGIYKFTVHTKPSPAPWKDNFVTWELVEAVAAPTTTEDMYIVGKIASKPLCQWPGYTDLTNCIHMTFDGDKTWSAQVELKIGDQFKVYNKLNQQYYPDQGGNLGRPSGTPDGLFEVTWVSGATAPTVKHIHTFTKWCYDAQGHWKECKDNDGVVDDSSRGSHDFGDSGTCECGLKQEADPHWQIGADGKFEAYTGEFENITIPANLKEFPAMLSDLFGKGSDGCPNEENWKAVKSVTVAPGNTSFKMENGALLSMDGTVLYAYFAYNTATEITFENVEKLGNAAFCFNDKLETLNLPKLTTLGTYAFWGMTAIKEFSFPNVETVVTNAFTSCSATKIELEGARELQMKAIFDCGSLQTIVFGTKLTKLGSSMLIMKCSQLVSVTFKAPTPPVFGGSLIYMSGSSYKIYVPEGSVDAYKAAWSKDADKIEAIPAEAASAQEVALPASKKED